jgi:hypothetical protein
MIQNYYSHKRESRDERRRVAQSILATAQTAGVYPSLEVVRSLLCCRLYIVVVSSWREIRQSSERRVFTAGMNASRRRRCKILQQQTLDIFISVTIFLVYER